MLEMRSDFYRIVCHIDYIIYKNTKRKYPVTVRIFSLTSDALKEGLIPDYANIKISNISTAVKV